MPEGEVKWFDRKKGYGFITSDNNEDVFVHYSAITMDGYRVLDAGQRVSFEMSETERGLQASEVKLAE